MRMPMYENAANFTRAGRSLENEPHSSGYGLWNHHTRQDRSNTPDLGRQRLSRLFLTLFIGALVVTAWMAGAEAAPRDGAPQRPAATPRNQPSATVPQTEPMDLDEGKSAQQMFSSSCSVCHQSPAGLAKGRGAGQLSSFLRQHYTTGSGQASSLASFLASPAFDRGAPTPVRASPGDKPDKPEKPEQATRKPKPEEARRDSPVAATHPQRRIRNEDGTTQPVDGLVVLPPGASEVPDDDRKPAVRRRETRPDAVPGRQRQPRPSEIKPAETKPAEPAQPVEVAKPAEPESAPPPVQAEAPKPPRDPAGAHSSLTEEKPKPAPADVQEIPL
jgi:mono/diheme cytochrome c family protein